MNIEVLNENREVLNVPGSNLINLFTALQDILKLERSLETSE